MTDKKYNGWNDSDTRSSGVPKNEGMTKEQIEQAAKDRYPIPEYTDIDSLPHLEQCRIVEMIEFIDNERAAFIAGATSPEAKAYHGQGWVSVEDGINLPDKTKVIGWSEDYEDFGEVVFDKGYFMSVNDHGELFHSEFADMVTHYIIPSPPNTEK